MVMFNFQFWWIQGKQRLLLSFNILCISMFVLFNKPNCFGAAELHAVQLTVTPFHLTALTELMLYYYKFIVLLIELDRIICFAGSSYFFHISRSYARTHVKPLIVKFRLLPRKFQFQVFQWQHFQHQILNIVVT